MTESTPSSLACANCGRPLDPADKFCRECGLPTLRRAEAQRRTPQPPPDTGEFRRAMDAVPDPRPFLRPDLPPARPRPRPEPEPAEPAGDSTGSVVNATNPTQTNTMAFSTIIMLVLMGLFGLAGIIFLVLALLT